jgi:hypothetical protein
MKQRRLRFRLATLLLVVALSAVAIEVIAYRVRQDALFLAELEQALKDYKKKYNDPPHSRIVIPTATLFSPH